MELRQVRYFLKVAELQNFTEAAKSLFIAQSTLSQQINQLENDLGVLLFDRVGKRLYLTEAGQEFIPLAKQTIQDADLAKQRLLDLQGIRAGSLRVGRLDRVEERAHHQPEPMHPVCRPQQHALPDLPRGDRRSLP